MVINDADVEARVANPLEGAKALLETNPLAKPAKARMQRVRIDFTMVADLIVWLERRK